MIVKIYLKDSPIIKEFVADSYWTEGETFVFGIKNRVLIYPFRSVWRVEIPREFCVIKEGMKT